MPDRTRRPKRPRDVSQLAKAIIDEATGQAAPEEDPRDEISKAAAALGRLGGKKGGPARAKKLSPERRSEIARQAARSRWERTRSDSEFAEQEDR